jgi:hypothetical protein
MNNQPCVSLEMAQRLEAEGFFFNPKSPFQIDRFIWAKGLEPYNKGKFTLSYGDPRRYLPEWEPVYAPTATELLPKGWILENGHAAWHAHNKKRGRPTFPNENPHDAAAMAWLWEKENGQ